VSASDGVRLVSTRAAILDAAEALFAANGYGATSLQQIGEAAALSRGTPSYFFKTKEGLYNAVIERMFARAQDALAPSYRHAEEADADLDELVFHLVEAHVEFLAANPALVRLFHREVLENGTIVERLREPAAETTRLLQGLRLRYGVSPLDDAEAAALVATFAALCAFPLTYAEPLFSTLGIHPSDPGYVQSHVRNVADFVLLHLRA
jgi:AcrR family transcriptional regulator